MLFHYRYKEGKWNRLLAVSSNYRNKHGNMGCFLTKKGVEFEVRESKTNSSGEKVFWRSLGLERLARCCDIDYDIYTLIYYN